MIWPGDGFLSVSDTFGRRRKIEMPKKDRLYEWCIEEEKIMERALERLNSGTMRIGEVMPDGSLEDQTEQSKADLHSRLAVLRKIIAEYDLEDT